jgi:hypothetical protein
MTTFSLKNLFNSRDLLSAWTMRIIRCPLPTVHPGWAVGGHAANRDGPYFYDGFFVLHPCRYWYNTLRSICVYTAIVPWMLFSTSVTDMIDSITVNMNLVSKIHFPREVSGDLDTAGAPARFCDCLHGLHYPDDALWPPHFPGDVDLFAP